MLNVKIINENNKIITFSIWSPESAVLAASTIGFIEGMTKDESVAAMCEEALDQIRVWIVTNYRKEAIA